MRIAVESHGCRLNQAEGEALCRGLTARGHELVEGVENADVFVLNGCTITHRADADARQAVRRASRRNPELRVIVTGCYANAHPQEAAALPGVSAVRGNREKEGIADDLDGDPSEPIRVSQLTRKLRPRPEPWQLKPRGQAKGRTRPMLKIQDGCDYGCTFCVVPSVRGPNRSLDLERLCEQLVALEDDGAAEVVLTGAHLGTYGRDRGQRDGLEALLRDLLVASRRVRLRLGSIDPHEISDSLIALLATNTRVCAHLHLPIQSGSDRILTQMRRGHRAADLDRLVPKLREARPDIALGSDIIVGFPGETDDDFEQTYARAGLLDYGHVFAFSAREGTVAATMDAAVSPEVMASRSRALRGLLTRRWERFARRAVGQILPGIVEPHRRGPVAVTHNFLRVRVDERPPPERGVVGVEIQRFESGELVGRIQTEDAPVTHAVAVPVR
jgi:threonylcarbamoyladenosine tRNA methylthiotransferase MtaB